MSLVPTELFRWGPKAYSAGSGGFTYNHQEGYRRETEYHLNVNPRLSAEDLAKQCLLGSPLVHRRETRSKDRVLYRDMLERLAPIGAECVFFQQSAEVYRALRVTRLAMGFLSASVRRSWRRVPSLCYRFPVRMAELASELSADLRTYGITGRWNPKAHFLWSIFRPKNRAMGLQGGHLKRCLPAPAKVNKEALLQDFVSRLTQPPLTPGGGDFRRWISDWVSFNRPKTAHSHFDVEVTHSACLELPRGQDGVGGGAALVPHLIEVGKKAEHYVKWRDFMLRGIERLKYSSVELPKSAVEDFRRTVLLVVGCLEKFHPMIEHRKVCNILTCTERGVHPRVNAIVILEKGNKTRIPTMTSVVEQILASVFRSSVQPFLENDPRIRASVRGELRIPKQGPEHEVWRSQDLTTATDDHDLESTPHLYREISKVLETPSWWGPVIDTITGPHEIITKKKLKSIRDHFEYGVVMDGPRVKASTVTYDGWDLTRYPSGPISRRGQFMGTATSWPLLPLVTLYAFETSSTAPSLTLTREVAPLPTKRMPNFVDAKAWFKSTSHAPALVEVSRQVPSNWTRLDTTGDDCIASMTLEHSAAHSQMLERIGGRVSKTKDYEDPRRAVYVEVMLLDGKPEGIPPLGTIVKARGVRNPSWEHFSHSFRTVCAKHAVSRTKREKVYRLATFYPLLRALRRAGAPVSYPPPFGGVDAMLPETPLGPLQSSILRVYPHLTVAALQRRLGVVGDIPWDELQRPQHRPGPVALIDSSFFGDEYVFNGKTSSTKSPDTITYQGRAKTELLNEVVYKPMSAIEISQVWARTRRWDQVEYHLESIQDQLPRNYLRRLQKAQGPGLMTLEPTRTHALSKAHRVYMIPWDTLTARVGARMSLGPLGPSSPNILLHPPEMSQKTL